MKARPGDAEYRKPYVRLSPRQIKVMRVFTLSRYRRRRAGRAGGVKPARPCAAHSRVIHLKCSCTAGVPAFTRISWQGFSENPCRALTHFIRKLPCWIAVHESETGCLPDPVPDPQIVKKPLRPLPQITKASPFAGGYGARPLLPA